MQRCLPCPIPSPSLPHAFAPPHPLAPPAGMVCIFAWSAAINGSLFLTLRRIGWLRASKEDEMQGLDYSQVGWVGGWFSKCLIGAGGVRGRAGGWLGGRAGGGFGWVGVRACRQVGGRMVGR